MVNALIIKVNAACIEVAVGYGLMVNALIIKLNTAMQIKW